MSALKAQKEVAHLLSKSGEDVPQGNASHRYSFIRRSRSRYRRARFGVLVARSFPANRNDIDRGLLACWSRSYRTRRASSGRALSASRVFFFLINCLIATSALLSYGLATLIFCFARI